MPILCNYYVTYRCNARCAFCNIWQDEKYRQVPDPAAETVERNLAGLRKVGVKFVDFTGGEPLLYREIARVLRAAKNQRLVTSITTNGILYPAQREELKGLVDLLHFSLDAAGRERHDARRGVPCFDRVMESLELVQHDRIKADILFTVTTDNFQEIPAVATLAKEHRMVFILNPVFSYFGNPGLSALALEAMRKEAQKPYVYVNKGFLRLLEEGGNQVGSPRCKAVTSTLVISPDNHLLIPCFHHARERIKIQDSLPQALAGEQIQNMKQQQGRFPFCQGCTINCYFEPSFVYGVDAYFWANISSKLKYFYYKYIRR